MMYITFHGKLYGSNILCRTSRIPARKVGVMRMAHCNQRCGIAYARWEGNQMRHHFTVLLLDSVPSAFLVVNEISKSMSKVQTIIYQKC